MTYCDWVPGTALPHDWFSCAWAGSFGFYFGDTFVGQGPLSLAVALFLGLVVVLLVWPEISRRIAMRSRSSGRS